MILFVDYEHEEGFRSQWGPKLLAARTTITYRLEDLAKQHCMLVRHDRITPGLLATVDPQAVFISGNGTDPDRYDPASLQPLRDLVSSAAVPTFGFCGGFQFMAQTFGSDLMPIKTDVAAEHQDRLAPFPDGQLAELGYHPVEIDIDIGTANADHPLLDGIGTDPVFRHAHRLEVPAPPDGFTVLASSPITRVQMAVDEDRRAVGTQFHPEYFTEEYPAGQRLISNFLSWAGIV